MKLLTVDTISQAQDKLYGYAQHILPKTETVTIENAVGRILAQNAFAQENVPDFYRSTVDGYAVTATDTQGASESIPTFLRVVEEVAIGYPAKSTIKSGECVYVPTGGMLPAGADAMVMIEYTEMFSADEIAVYESVAKGKCVVTPGEDIAKGAVVVKKGTVLKAEHIGALASAGVWEIEVYVPWRVSIISTGDELIAPYDTLAQGQVRDVNTWSLNALATDCGFSVVRCIKVKDDEALFRAELEKAKQDSDVVLTSGGSSQGKKDMTNDVMDSVCDEGTFTHGLSIKPGKPTILAFDKASATFMIGLPGHPVASLTVFQALLVNLWKTVTHQPPQKPIPAKMETNVAGAPGKTTFLLAKIYISDNGEVVAKPVLAKSGLINSMVDTDGYIEIDMNKEGLKKGETVFVHRFGL
ncbi:MAG: molybdopterin molybdotransferase MoeA [Oscillospiraceae bacterium]|nr:molybdopterin molybdotransferase MoeA [Oscillospiraceae bacterium]